MQQVLSLQSACFLVRSLLPRVAGTPLAVVALCTSLTAVRSILVTHSAASPPVRVARYLFTSMSPAIGVRINSKKKEIGKKVVLGKLRRM